MPQKYLSPGGGGLVSSRGVAGADPDAVRGASGRCPPGGRPGAVRSVARIDFLEQGDEVWVNEINTIPGSLSVYLFVRPGRWAEGASWRG